MLKRWFTRGRVEDDVEPADADSADDRAGSDIQRMVEGWADGRASVDDHGALRLAQAPVGDLASRVRQAYDWISEHAILCDVPDLEIGEAAILQGPAGTVEVRREGGYSSYVLIPLLGLVTSSNVLLVGAPGRGKTTIATLMGLLAGGTLHEVRRGTQRGHPQLTVADLLGTPLPGDLVRAESVDDIRVAFRGWLTRRVKIVDEFNRLPTKTQSALLSLMAEGCAELYEQVVETGPSAWYLTANDELGGGTFQVIDALLDRIDVVVRATPFSSRHTAHLAARTRSSRGPEEDLPDELRFGANELEEAAAQIRAVEVTPEALFALGTFASQLDFCGRASAQLHHMNKDTLALSGRRLAHVCNEDCPLDKLENVCSQAEKGISTRAQLSALTLAKAFAWFRGAPRADVDDLRLLLPWVLHERLRPNLHGEFFVDEERQVYLADRASWIRQAFDQAVGHARAHAGKGRGYEALREATESALASGDASAVRKQALAIEKAIERVLARSELNALVHEDLVRLRALHARCQRSRR